jgi:hypothetical protein
MKKIIFILAILSFCLNNTNSQENEWASYFPLKVGNTWYYRTWYFPFPMIGSYHKEYIDKDSLINGIKYYKLIKNLNNYEWLRIDSVKGNLLVYSPGSGCGSYSNDKIIDSLASSLNDQINCLYNFYFTRRCNGIGTTVIFNDSVRYKSFSRDGLFVGGMTYAKNFGVIKSCSGEPPPCQVFTDLIGCRIDGIVYGDTNLVNIEQTSSEVPNGFFLYQNYPNPFNPVTNLEFGISDLGFVELKVYDINGRQVAILVNEKLSPGNYKIRFDGSNYPSGIYYYKLEAGDFSEVRKMILLK